MPASSHWPPVPLPEDGVAHGFIFLPVADWICGGQKMQAQSAHPGESVLRDPGREWLGGGEN